MYVHFYRTHAEELIEKHTKPPAEQKQPPPQAESVETEQKVTLSSGFVKFFN
jgi:hypothetical protein